MKQPPKSLRTLLDRTLGAEAKQQIAGHPRIYARNLAYHAYDLWSRPTAWGVAEARPEFRAAIRSKTASSG